MQNQIYKDIELIVIDDASDTWHKKKNEVLAKNTIYHYISKEESKGGNYARNVGINISKGLLIAFLDDDDIAEIISYGNKASDLFRDSNHMIYEARERVHESGLAEHDSCPIIFTAYPELFEGQKCGIYVETQGTITQGKTVTDLWSDYKFPDRHCTFILNVDQPEFAKLIKTAYKAY